MKDEFFEYWGNERVASTLSVFAISYLVMRSLLLLLPLGLRKIGLEKWSEAYSLFLSMNLYDVVVLHLTLVFLYFFQWKIMEVKHSRRARKLRQECSKAWDLNQPSFEGTDRLTISPPMS